MSARRLGDVIDDLRRAAAGLEAQRATLQRLALAGVCPQSWIAEHDRMRRRQLDLEESKYAELRRHLETLDRLAPSQRIVERFDEQFSRPTLLPGVSDAARLAAAEGERLGFPDLMRSAAGSPPSILIHAFAGLPAAGLGVITVRRAADGYAGVLVPLVWLGVVVTAGWIVSAIVDKIVEDEGTKQHRDAVRLDLRFYDAIEPLIEQITSGMRSGNITPDQAATLLGRIRSISPQETISAVPGLEECGPKSCWKWLVGPMVLAMLLAAAIPVARALLARRAGRLPAHREPKLLPAKGETE